MLLLQHGKDKKQFDEFCEEQAFSYLYPKGRFGYDAPQDMPISSALYFNQRLLNCNQYFASDADNIFFDISAYDQQHLCSSINFAMHKYKLGMFTGGTVKNSFKGTIKKIFRK